jgi:competence protein ComEA
MSEPVPSRSPWYLLERDQAILYALGLLLLLTGAYCYVAGQWAAPAGVRALEPGQGIDYRVDLNRADVAELDLLPGIGPAKAARIVEYRKAHGPFQGAAGLAKVGGISRQCIAKLRGLVAPDDAPPAGGPPR